MTEYDFSPEAYDRHLQNMNRIGNWVQRTNAHSSQFKSPFDAYSPSPPRRRSPSPSTSSDDEDYHNNRHRHKHRSKNTHGGHRTHHKSRSHSVQPTYVAPPPAPSRRTTSSSQTGSSSAPRTPQPPGVVHRGMTYHGHAAPAPVPHVAPLRSNTMPGPIQYYPQPQISVIPPNGKPVVVYGGNQQQQYYQGGGYYQQSQPYQPQPQYPTQSYHSPATSAQAPYASPGRINTPWFKRIFSINIGDKSREGSSRSRDSSSSSRKEARSSHEQSRHRDEGRSGRRSRRTSY